MKNKMRCGLLLAIICASVSLAGCSGNNNKEVEITDEMVTSIIDNSNIKADVNIGEYESMLTGDCEDVPEDAQAYSSSTVLDAPRDYVTTVIYSDDETPNLQTVRNLLNNIKNANDELGIISIKDRGGEYAKNNLLTLSDGGTELTVTMPGGYEYGEVYQIQINDAPYLSFKDKSDSIRTLTIEIEDDPNEEATYNEKQLKSDIINIDFSKVSNKKENQEQETYTFDYEGQFPSILPGQVFHAEADGGNKVYFDFYGVYQSQEKIDDLHTRITYTAPRMDQIYDSYRQKGVEPIDVSDADILLDDELAALKFKQSGVARGLVRALLPRVNYKSEEVSGILSNLKIHLDIDNYDNRVAFKVGIGVTNLKIANRWFFTLDVGYEKVTDYYFDFDISVRTEWIFPVGVDYKVKCIEDTQEAYYFKVRFTKALQPDVTDPDADKGFWDELSDNIDDIRSGTDGITNYAAGDDEIGPSTSGSRTTWPLFQVNIYYFAPITLRLQGEVYIDAAFQIDVLVKKEIYTKKVDFNFNNVDGDEMDSYNEVMKESHWVFALIGSVHFELGFKASFSISILGMYDYLRAQAYAEAYVNLSASGLLVLDTSNVDSGYIGLDLAVSAGVRVGLNFKILIFEKTITKTLWFDYLYRIKYDNSIERFSSTLSESAVEMDGIQTLNLDDTDVLWMEVFDSVTMSLKTRKIKAKEEFSIFSGKLARKDLVDLTSGHIFTYKSNNENLITVDTDGVIRVKDGTPNEFTASITIGVSNWAGYASDKTVNVHFVARDTHEVYADDTLIGTYRKDYQFTLPEGPFIYGKEFLAYTYNGKEYKPGDKITMTSDTMRLGTKYRILPYYTVYFFDGLGNVVSEESVMEGEAAIAPSALMRDRYMKDNTYVFLNWDADFSKVMGDLLVRGVYAKITEVK